MLQPLKQFYCDGCGGVIERPEDGWVEWLYTTIPGSRLILAHSYKIVHHVHASPAGDREGCYYHYRQPKRKYARLQDFTDDNLLYHDARDIREFNELMRRLTIPYYEEARWIIMEKAKTLDHYRHIDECLPNGRFYQGIIMMHGGEGV